jgi:S-DNA-T family DNA segregation ATPase FtsK/SpoIIIE
MVSAADKSESANEVLAETGTADDKAKPKTRRAKKGSSAQDNVTGEAPVGTAVDTEAKARKSKPKEALRRKPSKGAMGTPNKASPEWVDRAHLLFRECAIVLLGAIALYFLIVLATYNAGDPGFNLLEHDTPIQNEGGRVGAFLADLLLTLFGYIAYSVPFVLCLQIYRIIRPPYEEDQNLAILLMRTVGGILLLTSNTTLFSILVPTLTPLPVSSGGVLGDTIAVKFVSMFSASGAILIWGALLLIGMTLMFDISWAKVFGGLARLLVPVFPWMGHWVSVSTRGGLARIRGHRSGQAGAHQLEPVLAVPQLTTMALPEQPAESRAGAIITAPASKSMPREKTRPKRRKRIFNKLGRKDLPAIDLLDPPDDYAKQGFSEEDLKHLSETLVVKLSDFGIQATVEAVLPGPVITRFEIQPAPGVKVSRITNLAKDLARSLAVVSVRVVEVIPGKTVVGIEIPNTVREMIRLQEVVASEVYEASESALTLSLGKDIAGYPIVADLGRMPHLLVAGTTGSGKSVGLNAMLISMLIKATPDQLRLIMIDPKMLELSVYDDIPHLLAPVVTDMKEAANALRWCVAEMERRYKLMAALGVRNIAGYNRKVKEAADRGEPLKDPLFKPMPKQPRADIFETEAADDLETHPDLETLPKIVVVVDEFADMMMIVGKKVEELIARIAQKARAAGIHLILATQRPSVDVITGLIKANVPSRIAFQVSSKVDSRTILDQGGAEQLLGHGDMLYLPPGTGLPMRVHGAFVSDDEVHRICDNWRARAEPDYLDEVLDGQIEEIPGTYMPGGYESSDDESDPLYDEAVRFVTETRKASISSVQRKLKIGYNRAARMIEVMESAGVVSTMGTNGSREVLAPPPVALS